MVNYIYNATTGRKETIDSLRAGPNKQVWETAPSNKWGRLAKGNKHNVSYTDTIEFIPF